MDGRRDIFTLAFEFCFRHMLGQSCSPHAWHRFELSPLVLWLCLGGAGWERDRTGIELVGYWRRVQGGGPRFEKSF
jgi:hypothetical protein